MVWHWSPKLGLIIAFSRVFLKMKPPLFISQITLLKFRQQLHRKSLTPLSSLCSVWHLLYTHEMDVRPGIFQAGVIVLICTHYSWQVADATREGVLLGERGWGLLRIFLEETPDGLNKSVGLLWNGLAPGSQRVIWFVGLWFIYVYVHVCVLSGEGVHIHNALAAKMSPRSQ